jgi:hypothetical protein
MERIASTPALSAAKGRQRRILFRRRKGRAAPRRGASARADIEARRRSSHVPAAAAVRLDAGRSAARMHHAMPA